MGNCVSTPDTLKLNCSLAWCHESLTTYAVCTFHTVPYWSDARGYLCQLGQSSHRCDQHSLTGSSKELGFIVIKTFPVTKESKGTCSNNRAVLTSAAHGASQVSLPVGGCTVNKPLSPLTVHGRCQQPHSAAAGTINGGKGWGGSVCAEARRGPLSTAAPWKQRPGEDCGAAPPLCTADGAGWVWAHGGETRRVSS